MHAGLRSRLEARRSLRGMPPASRGAATPEPETWLHEILLSGTEDARELALKNVYLQHGGAVLSFVRFCLGEPAPGEHRGAGESMAAQVTTEAFVQLWRQPRSFEPSRGSMRWHLMAEAYRRCMAHLEERPRVGSASQSTSAARVTRALPMEERVVLGLAHFGQLSVAEVGQLVGLNAEDVKSTMSQALYRLSAGGRTQHRRVGT